MATIKISELPEASSLVSSDLLTAVATNVSSKITLQNFAKAIPQVSSSISASYALSAGNGGVTSIIAGTGISIDTGTGNVTVTNTGGGGGSTFPYTGSAIISGSLQVTGSVSSTGGFTGSLRGTASWAENAISSSYPIAVTGSTLYSISPLAGPNFNTNNSIFLGDLAASGALAAEYSIFMGSTAGLAATNANLSIFLGSYAGREATNAHHSVFIGGDTAGYQAINASYSNFIGWDAGSNATDAQQSNFFGASAGSGATKGSYSNFIGRFAGYQATGVTETNFLGTRAGFQATDVTGSNFFGYNTGRSAYNSKYSNFIGYETGYEALYAEYSNLIGYKAGYRLLSSGIGSNNIIIGTNITLPENYNNGINIGGLIFGSGSYFNVNNMSSGSANGKIGINQSLPQYTLDVSGSGKFTDNVIITGSLVVSGSNGAGIFSQGATLVDYTDGISNSGSYMVWRAPFSCSVVGLYGYYVGGTSPQVNALRSGSSGIGRITGSNLTLSSQNVWIAALPNFQNSDFNIGDGLTVIMSGSANNQLAVQVDFIRKF